MSCKSVPALGKDWLTPFFDVLLAIVGLGGPLTERVIEGAHIQDGKHVLDVSCGTATQLIAAKSRSPLAQTVGVYSDKRALAIARKKIAQHQVEVEVVQAGAEHVPFPTSSFDLVMSTLVFHHLPTEIKQRAIQEIYRVLTPAAQNLFCPGRPGAG